MNGCHIRIEFAPAPPRPRYLRVNQKVQTSRFVWSHDCGGWLPTDVPSRGTDSELKRLQIPAKILAQIVPPESELNCSLEKSKLVARIIAFSIEAKGVNWTAAQ